MDASEVRTHGDNQNSYHLEWYGPFQWVGDGGESVFTSSVRDRSGLYLWTVPYEGQNLVYYVGETGRSFIERMTEHTKEYLGGGYRVYDPIRFAEGKKDLVWGGMWKPGTRHNMGLFLARYHELSPVIVSFLRLLKVYFAPIDTVPRVRQRIESAIALSLRHQPGVVGDFQDDDIHYAHKTNDEDPIMVTMTFPEPMLGLQTNLLA